MRTTQLPILTVRQTAAFVALRDFIGYNRIFDETQIERGILYALLRKRAVLFVTESTFRINPDFDNDGIPLNDSFFRGN